MSQSGRFVSSVRLIALLTLVSRVLGLCREVVFGYFFATSQLMSAFRIAFMVPNLARRLFGEGALSAALIPTLASTLERDGEASSRRFLGSLLVSLVTMLVGAVILGELALVGLRWLHDDSTLVFAAILLPYMPMICLVAVFGSVLQVRRRFGLPAAMPIVLNLCILLSALIGATLFGLKDGRLMRAVCVSILAAGVFQLGAAYLGVRRSGLAPSWSGGWRDSRVRSVVRLMGPAILGLSTVQLNTLADYLIAYFFVVVDGERIGPAVLGYAQYLYQLPLGIFGIAIATAIFPDLSEKAAKRDMSGLARDVQRGLRLAFFVALPAMTGLMIVARPLVASLFEHGSFQGAATGRVSSTLVFYCVGLCAYFAMHVLVRTFYALHDTGTPAKTAAWMVLLNLCLNFALVRHMAEQGLALSTSICALLQVVWLGGKLRARLKELAWTEMLPSFSKTFGAATVMGAALLVTQRMLHGCSWISGAPIWELAILVVAGIVGFCLAAYLFKAEELRMLWPRFRDE